MELEFQEMPVFWHFFDLIPAPKSGMELAVS